MTITPELSAKITNISAVCAFMVVILHSGAPTAHGSNGWFLVNFLQGFAKASVPFFFIASGFFLAGHIGEEGWWKRETSKRVRSLLLPFWVWGAIWWLYLLVIGLVSDLAFGRPLGSYFPQQFTLGKFVCWTGLDFIHEPIYSVTWYLRSLFLYVVLSPLVALGVRRLGWWLITVLFCLDPWGLNKCGLGVFQFLYGLAYFALGLGLRRGWITPPQSLSWRCGVLCGALALLAVIARVTLNYLGLRLPFSTFGLTIPLTLLALWGLVPDRPFVRWVTAVSMPVYLLHTFFISVFRIAVRPNEDVALVIFAELFFAYGAAVFTANVFARFVPVVYSVLFGGRAGGRLRILS